MIRMVAGRTPAALTVFLSAEPLPGDDEATSTEPQAGSDAPGHPRLPQRCGFCGTVGPHKHVCTCRGAAPGHECVIHGEVP